MQKIFDLISGFFTFIADIPGWLLEVVMAVINSFLTMLKDLFSWAFESILVIALNMLNSLDLSALNNGIGALGSLPVEVVNVLSLCGIGECLAIIFSAIVIRIGLQLIPFTRLGS